MRRLNDITTFRRHWYSKKLVEDLFIGTDKKPAGTPEGEAPDGAAQIASGGESSAGQWLATRALG